MWAWIGKAFGGAIKPIVGVVGTAITNRQARMAMVVELNGAIHKAKLENIKAGRIAEVEWNRTAKATSGWIDDYLTIILSLPMILVFIPDLVPHIKAGFAVLEETPVWYRSAIAVMISAGFGYKKFADWQMAKHYTLPDPQDKVKDL